MRPTSGSHNTTIHMLLLLFCLQPVLLHSVSEPDLFVAIQSSVFTHSSVTMPYSVDNQFLGTFLFESQKGQHRMLNSFHSGDVPEVSEQKLFVQNGIMRTTQALFQFRVRFCSSHICTGACSPAAIVVLPPSVIVSLVYCQIFTSTVHVLSCTAVHCSDMCDKRHEVIASVVHKFHFI